MTSRVVLSRRILPAAFVGASLCFAGGADWLQFRGNDGTSVAPDKQLPIAWGKKPADDKDALGENVAWRADVPGRGVSGPIVVSGKVIVTSTSGFKHDRLHVLAYDAANGALLWERQFWATGRTLCHPTSSVAAPTPASDGESIFAFYSSNDLVCLDLEGNLKWFRGLSYDSPTAANDVGMAASPLVVGQTVVVQVENKGDSFAAGLDTATGETRWRLAREQAMNWTSPAVLRGKTPADDAVLLQSPGVLSAVRPETGDLLWSYATGCSIIPSLTTDQGLVYLPAAGLTALKPSDRPGSHVEVAWSDAKLGPASSSPVVYDGKVYVINGAPALTCAEAATGKVLWRLRLSGKFWATPVLAGDHLYCVSEQGLAQVVKLGDEGQIAAENDFGEPVLGTPAVADGAIYFRSDSHLFKIANR